ncbi:MAG: hypothetical protein ACJ76Z_10190 [Thermoleophilaceae bacterium]
MRWRLRGGVWLWPAFAAAILVDAAILHFLPPVGTDQQIDAPAGLNLVGDVLVASFANLFLVGAIAPWLARRLAARAVAPAEPAPPFEVHLGRIAAILMAAGALGLVVVGVGNRPLIVSETEATEANARTVRAWVFSHGNPEMRRNLDSANTSRLAPNFFRTCIARDDRRRAFCFFVDTKADPPTIRRDPDSRPNSPAVNR